MLVVSLCVDNTPSNHALTSVSNVFEHPSVVECLSSAETISTLGPASKHNHTHQLLLDNTKKVIVTHDVLFQEHVIPAKRITFTSINVEIVNDGQHCIKLP